MLPYVLICAVDVIIFIIWEDEVVKEGGGEVVKG
jgi:hypothetical protein